MLLAPEELDFILGDVGEPVAYGAQSGYGLLDTPGLDVQDQMQFRYRGYSRVLVLREGAFAGLTQDAKIAHAGVDYTIRDIGTAGTDGLRRLLVTLGFTPVSLPATIPTTPQDLVAAHNALGGGTAGLTFRVFWLTGLGPVYQTIVQDAFSPTGYYCTKIENLIAVGDGNHLRPRVDVPQGAPCTVDGRLMGKGLYCPGTAPYFAAPGFRDDTTSIASVSGHLPNTLFTDRGAGWSVLNFGRIRAGSWSWRFGPQAGPNMFGFGGDSINGPNFEPLKDPQANCGAPFTLNGGGSTMMVADTHVVHTQFGPVNGVLDGNFARHRYGPDLMQDVGYQIAGSLDTAGRDFTVLDSNGIEPNADTEWVGAAIGDGRQNLPQTTLVRLWSALQPWGAGLWVDTRDLGFIFGDSELDPLRTMQADGMDHVGHICRGFMGRTRIPNFTATLFARAGNTPDSYQYPFIEWMKDCDFTNRGKLAVLMWETNNMAGGVTEALQENYAWGDLMGAFLGAKGKRVAFSRIYDTDQKKALLEPGVWNDLSVNWPQHYDGLINNHDALDFTPFNQGDFTTDPVTGPRAEWWVSRHPKEPDTQQYLEGFWYSGLKLALGQDLSTQSMKVDPAADHVALSGVGSTFSFAPTAKRYDGIALGGKTFTFTSRNPAIATVNSAGLITSVGAGDVAIDCWSNDGAKGTIIVQVTGGGPTTVLSHTFSVDNPASVPAADTGQVSEVQNDGVWATSGGQLKRATPGVGGSHDKVVWDAGVVGGTYKVTLAVLQQLMGIVWGDSDVENNFMSLVDLGGGTLGVFRRQAASDSQIDHGIVHTWAPGDTLGVIRSSDGHTHQIIINDVVVDTITDAFNPTATKVGAIAIGGDISGRWDNAKMTVP